MAVVETTEHRVAERALNLMRGYLPIGVWFIAKVRAANYFSVRQNPAALAWCVLLRMATYFKKLTSQKNVHERLPFFRVRCYQRLVYHQLQSLTRQREGVMNRRGATNPAECIRKILGFFC